MKIILILFMLSQSSFLSAQNNDKIEYKGDGIYFKFMNPETREVVSKVPVGKSPHIYYDTFFKSYDIFWTISDGSDERLTLSFIIEEDNYVKMSDTFGNTYMVFDYIDKSNSLVLFHDKMSKGMFILTVIEGIKKI